MPQYIAANGDVETVAPTGYVTLISYPFVLGIGEFSLMDPPPTLAVQPSHGCGLESQSPFLP